MRVNLSVSPKIDEISAENKPRELAKITRYSLAKKASLFVFFAVSAGLICASCCLFLRHACQNNKTDPVFLLCGRNREKKAYALVYDEQRTEDTK